MECDADVDAATIVEEDVSACDVTSPAMDEGLRRWGDEGALRMALRTTSDAGRYEDGAGEVNDTDGPLEKAAAAMALLRRSSIR